MTSAVRQFKFGQSLGGIFLLAISVSACSFKQAPTAGVHIDLRQFAKTSPSDRFSLAPVIPGATPTSLDSFNCFGVRVTGEGIGQSDLPVVAGQCATNAGAVTAGMVFPTTAEVSLDLLVPSGLKRKFELFGFVSSTSACPSLDGAIDDETLRDSLYLIGTAQSDVLADMPLSIQAAFTAASPVQPFVCAVGCNKSLSD